MMRTVLVVEWYDRGNAMMGNVWIPDNKITM